MKLTVAIKLAPTPEQADPLKETLRTANAAANYVSDTAWERRSFGKYRLQKLCYYDLKERFSLAAQIVIRALSKVSDAYKLDKKSKRTFRPLGAIAYDDRILSWKRSEVSIWTVVGRERIPYVYEECARRMLASRRGESDLVFREGEWYSLATDDVEEPLANAPEDWLGVDLGIRNIAADSEGETYSGGRLRGLRHRHVRIRATLRSRHTEAATKLLKKRKRKERRMAAHTNHVISKRIVRKAQDTNSGIALEDLNGIRERITVGSFSGERCTRGPSGSFDSLSSTRLGLPGYP
jgi:putative transposase